MINANELRIGNWILNGNDHPIEVGYHEIKYATLHPGTQNNYEPIPLTPEILEKCGFGKQDNNSHQLDTDVGFCLWGRNGEINVHAYEGDEIGEAVKHLHQLQNLYFALTGNEIEYKPS